MCCRSAWVSLKWLKPNKSVIWSVIFFNWGIFLNSKKSKWINWPSRFRARYNLYSSQCGDDAGRQMRLPGCLMFVTGTCGCVWWQELVRASVMQLGGLTSHSHGFKQSLSMIDGAFSHHPEWLWGYVASNVCATCALCAFVPMTMCKSLSATGLWHSASLCHSQSVDALRKKSCERRNWMSRFVTLAIPLSLVEWDLKRN